MEEPRNSFEISIKDDFFDTPRFTQLYNEIVYKQYTPNPTNTHILSSAGVETPIAQYIQAKCEKMSNKKFDLNLCIYTMVANVEPTVHWDYSKECSHQVLIYIRGDQDLHKGTGFYVKNGEDYQLNTHIGFRQNRAIFWDSRAHHSPLNFVAKNQTKRFSIVAQYKETK
tara:strand:- start:314 stop:820 length:507 start_codon:yes stop_codon:yes gene_type:complete